jgi:hypothetical protein
MEDKDKLFGDLRNDYILANELDRWIGYAYLKTFSNVGKQIPNINEERRSETSRGEISRNNDGN